MNSFLVYLDHGSAFNNVVFHSRRYSFKSMKQYDAINLLFFNKLDCTIVHKISELYRQWQLLLANYPDTRY